MKLDTKKMLMTIVFTVVLIITGVGNLAFLAEQSFILIKLFAIIAVFALAAAVMYFLTDFQKSSAKYFKLFIYLFILYEYSATIAFIIEWANANSTFFYFEAFIHPVVFLLLNVLMFKKDLGKKLSLLLSFIVFAAELLVFIICLIGISQINGFISFKYLSQLLMSLVLIIMQQMKYIDKTQRKTK